MNNDQDLQHIIEGGLNEDRTKLQLCSMISYLGGKIKGSAGCRQLSKMQLPEIRYISLRIHFSHGDNNKIGA